MSQQPLLDIQNLVKSFGALLATDHVSLQVLPNEIHALIGPNGAGKTTLLLEMGVFQGANLWCDTSTGAALVLASRRRTVFEHMHWLSHAGRQAK